MLDAVPVPPPGKRQVDNLARFPDGFDGFEGLEQNGALLGQIARFAQGMAEGPFEEDGAGRLDFFRVVPNDGDAHRRNALSFDFSLDQPHGLIADASGRGQQHQIDLVFLELAGNFRGARFDQGRYAAAVNMAHEAEMSD